MNWKAKTSKAHFEPNSTRIRRVFAFKPTYVNGTIVWLSFFDILEYYKVEFVQVDLKGEKTTFKIGNWVELDRKYE